MHCSISLIIFIFLLLRPIFGQYPAEETYESPKSSQTSNTVHNQYPSSGQENNAASNYEQQNNAPLNYGQQGLLPTQPQQPNPFLRSQPKLECLPEGLRLHLNPVHPFAGHVYVKGYFAGTQSCHLNYCDAPIQVPFFINVPYKGDCVVNRQKVASPPGVNYQVTVVVQHHRFFVTAGDRAYRLNCFYQEQSVDLDQEVQVQDLSSTNLAGETHPTCRYDVLSQSINGPKIRFANVGDPVVHKWSCQSEETGFLVHSCVVKDQSGQDFKLVDERGCITDAELIPPLQYSSDFRTAFTTIHAFRFADQIMVHFSCQLTLCRRAENGCEGIVPPVCHPIPIGPIKATYRKEEPSTYPAQGSSTHAVSEEGQQSSIGKEAYFQGAHSSGPASPGTMPQHDSSSYGNAQNRYVNTEDTKDTYARPTETTRQSTTVHTTSTRSPSTTTTYSTTTTTTQVTTSTSKGQTVVSGAIQVSEGPEDENENEEHVTQSSETSSGSISAKSRNLAGPSRDQPTNSEAEIPEKFPGTIAGPFKIPEVPQLPSIARSQVVDVKNKESTVIETIIPRAHIVVPMSGPSSTPRRETTTFATRTTATQQYRATQAYRRTETTTPLTTTGRGASPPAPPNDNELADVVSTATSSRATYTTETTTPSTVSGTYVRLGVPNPLRSGPRPDRPPYGQYTYFTTERTPQNPHPDPFSGVRDPSVPAPQVYSFAARDETSSQNRGNTGHDNVPAWKPMNLKPWYQREEEPIPEEVGETPETYPTPPPNYERRPTTNYRVQPSGQRVDLQIQKQTIARHETLYEEARQQQRANPIRPIAATYSTQQHVETYEQPAQSSNDYYNTRLEIPVPEYQLPVRAEQVYPAYGVRAARMAVSKENDKNTVDESDASTLDVATLSSTGQTITKPDLLHDPSDFDLDDDEFLLRKPRDRNSRTDSKNITLDVTSDQLIILSKEEGFSKENHPTMAHIKHDPDVEIVQDCSGVLILQYVTVTIFVMLQIATLVVIYFQRRIYRENLAKLAKTRAHYFQ